MNVKDYISSGIIESYVLGVASPEEQAEVESLCKQYPEVKQARIDFEITLEQEAMQNSVAPPPELKQHVFNAVLNSEAKVIPLNSGKEVVKTNWLRHAVAASVLLLAGSIFFNISQYNQNKDLQANYENSVARLNGLEKDMAMLVQNPNVKVAAMKGLESSPASFATVYWDTTSKDVYLLVNNLPKPANDKQYQLWALFDGKPIDVGMIEMDSYTTQKKLLLQMKNVKGAQAFAITLEKKGGNPTPQGSMYVLGNL
ncbi:MAG: anti-sigma factor [Chitinophagaceae bacterium]